MSSLERPERFIELLLDFLAEPPGEEVDETSAAGSPGERLRRRACAAGAV
ncbi:MAG: hypothetical protein R2736_05165 [Solirubrobacterales bacterium]